jgi:hypothetical protein
MASGMDVLLEDLPDHSNTSRSKHMWARRTRQHLRPHRDGSDDVSRHDPATVHIVHEIGLVGRLCLFLDRLAGGQIVGIRVPDFVGLDDGVRWRPQIPRCIDDCELDVHRRFAYGQRAGADPPASPRPADQYPRQHRREPTYPTFAARQSGRRWRDPPQRGGRPSRPPLVKRLSGPAALKFCRRRPTMRASSQRSPALPPRCAPSATCGRPVVVQRLLDEELRR